MTKNGSMQIQSAQQHQPAVPAVKLRRLALLLVQRASGAKRCLQYLFGLEDRRRARGIINYYMKILLADNFINDMTH